MVYYLVEVNNNYGNDKRLVITPDIIGNIKGSTEAETWLEAKEKLGFTLTPYQKKLKKNKKS